MGLTYECLKQYENAIDCFENLIEIKPENDKAQKTIIKLKRQIKEQKKNLKKLPNTLKILEASHNEISFQELSERTNVDKKSLKIEIEKLIFKKKISALIREDKLEFLKE